MGVIQHDNVLICLSIILCLRFLGSNEQQLAATNSALRQQVNQLQEELAREKGAARRNYFKRSELMYDINVIVSKKQAEWTTAILTGGFDYDSDRALHEGNAEEKDEKYFSKKGNLSFEEDKEECHLKDDEKPDDVHVSFAKKKVKSQAEKGNSSSEAEKAVTCRSAEEFHLSNTKDEKSSTEKGNSSSAAAKGNTPITTPATVSEVARSAKNDDRLPQSQWNSKTPSKTEEQGFFGNVFWGLLHHASSNL